jgi:glutamine synthetase
MNAESRREKGVEALPGSLDEAIRELQKDPLILDTLGSHVAENYIQGKIKEWDEYRTHVTTWERERYIINY